MGIDHDALFSSIKLLGIQNPLATQNLMISKSMNGDGASVPVYYIPPVWILLSLDSVAVRLKLLSG